MKKIIILFTVIVFLTNCNNNGKGGWSRQDEDKWMSSCMNQMQGNPNARDICSCVLQKAEKTFPTYMEEEVKGTAQQGQQWAQECLNGNNRNGGGVLGNNNGNNINGDDNNGNNNLGSSWSNADEQKFMNTCLQNAMNTGADEQTSRAHCDCTLKKIEKKHRSYAEANQKMTASDVTAIEQECLQEQNRNENQ